MMLNAEGSLRVRVRDLLFVIKGKVSLWRLD